MSVHYKASIPPHKNTKYFSLVVGPAAVYIKENVLTAC